MSMTRGVARKLLPCLLPLSIMGPLAGQPVPSTSQDRDSPRQLLAVKGEARVSVHTFKMQQGNTYRITAKADGFVPLVRMPGQGAGLFGNPPAVPLTNPPPFAPPNPGTRGGTAQVLFTPTATREYQIKVDYAAGTDLGKGPLPYTLTIERAVFKPLIAVSDGQLDVAEHPRKLEQGKVYGITVTGRGFAAQVEIVDGTRSVATSFNGRWFGFGPDAEFVTTMTFAPARTADYRIRVGAGPVSEHRKAALGYTTRIVELKVALSVQERLTKQDPPYPQRGGPHKVHAVRLEAGKTYQIDLMSAAFDAYLFLEDSAGKVLMQDDDGGEGLNARLIFHPARTDTYRIVATTFLRAGPVGPAGPYTLTVVENPNAQPRFRTPFSYGGGGPGFPK